MEPVRMASDFKIQRILGRRAIQSTAGAITVRGEKGDLVVEKVKVKRYIAGKRPDWATEYSSEDESDEELDLDLIDEPDSPIQVRAEDIEDLEEEERDEDNDEESHEIEAPVPVLDHGHRIHEEPEVIAMTEEEELEIPLPPDLEERHKGEESSDDEELDDEEIARRRALLRERAKQKKSDEVDILDVEEELEDDEEIEDESSEYEEYSDSDDETGPRLKPVFVRRTERITIQEREKLMEENEISEEKLKKIADERKRQSTRIVNEIIRSELKENQGVATEAEVVVTDDENDEEEYETWKVRELKRIKRDREEKETRVREALEIERIHNLTEEQRRAEFRNNPKQVTNKAAKGKYKFLQKYYHRGSFFINEEDDRLKRDFAAPTLEDHFDKTVLPKAMQVKNFGRSGRTKYTHLVDQDSTSFDSPWFVENAQNLKFHSLHGGGMKQDFKKPSKQRK